MTGRRLRSRAALTAQSSNAAPSSTRPRRGAAPQTSAQIERSSPEETRQSIHLTVKAAPSKLREATSGGTSRKNPGAVSSRNILPGKRSSRNSRTVRVPDTDDEDSSEEDPPEDEEMEDEEDEDAEGEEEDDMDAEGEEDVEMEDAPPPPPPVAKTRGIAKPIKPSINVLPPPISTVEAKESMMADDDDDDEELSELSEEEVEEDEAEDEDEDAEGEEEEEVPVAARDEEDEDDLDSDDDTPSGSRDETPDLSKLTRRQRALVIEGDDTDLMALSNEAQKKKHLTEAEITMRRAEMARRRKNLSEKRNEEEKMDTINRLLKKQPPKRQKRMVEITESGQEEEPEVEKASPLYVRSVQTVQGTQVAVPEDWLGTPAGRVFDGAVPHIKASRPWSGRIVEEVA